MHPETLALFCFLFGLGSTRLLLIALKIKPLNVNTFKVIFAWFVGGSSNFLVFWACSRSDLAHIPFGIVWSMSSYLGGLGAGLIMRSILDQINEWSKSPLEQVLRQNLSERQIDILIMLNVRELNITYIAEELGITDNECDKDYKIALKKLKDVGTSVLKEHAKNLKETERFTSEKLK